MTDKKGPANRSEEHTSELQSHFDLVCRLLLEKKNDRLRCEGAAARPLTCRLRAPHTHQCPDALQPLPDLLPPSGADARLRAPPRDAAVLTIPRLMNDCYEDLSRIDRVRRRISLGFGRVPSVGGIMMGAPITKRMLSGILGGLVVWLGTIFFFFKDTATTEIYTLSLHDALPI